MLFRISLQRDDVATAIESAVSTVINSGKRTPDIADADSTVVSTGELGSAIAQAI
jgi:3-isopropylmalate dehydrogenase